MCPMVHSNGDTLGPYLDENAWRLLATRLRLSPREVEIAHKVFTDLKESAIADDLGISPHSVRTHMERLYRKLSVQSRVELVVHILTTFLVLTEQEDSELPPICENYRTGQCPLRD